MRVVRGTIERFAAAGVPALILATAVPFSLAARDPLALKDVLGTVVLVAALGAMAVVTLQAGAPGRGGRPALVLDAAVVLGVLAAAIADLFPVYPGVGGREVSKVLVAAWAYGLGRLSFRADSTPPLLGGACAAAMAAALGVGLVQSFASEWLPYSLEVKPGEVTHSFAGTMANPDPMAAWLLVAMPLATLASKRRGWTGLVVAGGVAGILLTLSRSAYLALAVQALVVWRATGAGPGTWLRRLSGGPGQGEEGGRRRAGRWLWMGLAAGAVVSVMVLLNWEPAKKLLATRTLEQRRVLWGMAFEAWKERPLLGHGPGSFEALYSARRSGAAAEVGLVQRAWSAHDLILDGLVEYGLVGLAVLGGVLFSALKVGRRGVGTIAVVGLMAHGLAGVGARNGTVQILLAAALAWLPLEAPLGGGRRDSPRESARADGEPGRVVFAAGCALGCAAMFLLGVAAVAEYRGQVILKKGEQLVLEALNVPEEADAWRRLTRARAVLDSARGVGRAAAPGTSAADGVLYHRAGVEALLGDLEKAASLYGALDAVHEGYGDVARNRAEVYRVLGWAEARQAARERARRRESSEGREGQRTGPASPGPTATTPRPRRLATGLPRGGKLR